MGRFTSLCVLGLAAVAEGARVSHEATAAVRGQESALLAHIDTVPQLNLQAFLGRWYQMYNSISSTLLTFGAAGPQDTCTSADYMLDEDGTTINVLNQGIRLNGNVTQIFGEARATDQPGQRKLSFSKFIRDGREIAPPDFEGDYWIYHLGPLVDGSYAYAIVGGPAKPSWGLDKTQLFVLARDPISFGATYNAEVLDWLSANGFDWWWNKPRRTGSIGRWHTFPYPKFFEGDSKYGPWGQSGCAAVQGLSQPCDGKLDPRV